MPNFSPLDLRNMLPARSGLELQLYHQLLINDFSSVGFRDPSDICKDPNKTSIIFSEDESDNGSIFIFQKCADEKILFTPKDDVLSKNYERSLICIDSKNFISSFFSQFSNIKNGAFLFQAPSLVHWRKKRFNDRVHLQTEILIRRRNLQVIHGWLRDFSYTGLGFLVNEVDLAVGEIVLVELSIPNCGEIESTALIVRRENHLNRQFGLLVAARLLLTRQQEEYVRALYFCAQGKAVTTPLKLISPILGAHDERRVDPEQDHHLHLTITEDSEMSERDSEPMEVVGSNPKALPIGVSTLLSMTTPYQANFSSAPEANCAMIDTTTQLSEEPMTDSPHTSADEESAEQGTIKPGLAGDAAEQLLTPSLLEMEGNTQQRPPDLPPPAVIATLEQDLPEKTEQQAPATPLLPQSVGLSQEIKMSEEQPQQSSSSLAGLVPSTARFSSPRRISARIDLAAVLCSKAEVLTETEEYRDAIDYYSQSLATVNELPEADAATPKALDIRARALLGKTRSMFALGDSNASNVAAEAITALTNIQQAGKISRPRLGMDLAQAYMIRGLAAAGQDSNQAVEDYQSADNILNGLHEKLAEHAPLELLQLSARLALCIGNLYASEGSLTESLPHLERAHELSDHAMRSMPEEASWTLQVISASALLQKGNMFFQLGKEEDGQRITEEGIESWQKIRTHLADQFTSAHYAQLGFAQLQYAKLLSALGLYTQAETVLASAHPILQELEHKFGDALPPHVQQLAASMQLQESELALEQGKLAQASTNAQGVVATMRSLQERLGKQFSFEMRELLATALLALGKIHSALGNNKAALEAMGEAQQILAN